MAGGLGEGADGTAWEQDKKSLNLGSGSGDREGGGEGVDNPCETYFNHIFIFLNKKVLKGMHPLHSRTPDSPKATTICRWVTLRPSECGPQNSRHDNG